MVFDINKKPKVNLDKQIIHRSEEVGWPCGDYADILKFTADLAEKYSPRGPWKLTYSWVGYEDCIYEVEYEQRETDEELEARVEYEMQDLKEWEEKYAQVVAKSTEKQNREREERRKQWEKLNAEFSK